MFARVRLTVVVTLFYFCMLALYFLGLVAHYHESILKYIIISSKNIFAVKKSCPKTQITINHNCNNKIWYLVQPKVTLNELVYEHKMEDKKIKYPISCHKRLTALAMYVLLKVCASSSWPWASLPWILIEAIDAYFKIELLHSTF